MKSLWSMNLKTLTPAERTGIIAIACALVVLPFFPRFSAVPLAVFLILCFTAPFLPAYGFFLPVVSRGRTDKRAVAITFDDGPDPESTPALLHLLSKYDAKATFYVTGRRAGKYPDLIRKIISGGHTIGNHTYRHDNFIMAKSIKAIKLEIEKTQQVLQELGISPLTFRPPVGVTSPKLAPVLEEVGMYAVNFSRRAGDRGNRQIRALADKILKRLRPGDIIMLHDIEPPNGASAGHWLAEVDRMLKGIRELNLEVLPLANLIDRPVMENAGPLK